MCCGLTSHTRHSTLMLSVNSRTAMTLLDQTLPLGGHRCSRFVPETGSAEGGREAEGGTVKRAEVRETKKRKDGRTAREGDREICRRHDLCSPPGAAQPRTMVPHA